MIEYLTYCQIRSLHQDEKLTAGQIARKLQLDKKTIRYWLRHPYHEHKRPNRSSKLDPYKPRIKAWLEQHDFSAQQIFQKLRVEGVQVGYTIVREYVRSVRPKPVHAFLTLSFCSDECIQVDSKEDGVQPSAASTAAIGLSQGARNNSESRCRLENHPNLRAQPDGSTLVDGNVSASLLPSPYRMKR